MGRLCPGPRELFLAGPFPWGSSPPGTPGKRGPSSAGHPRAGRGGRICVWKQPPRDPRAGPGLRHVGLPHPGCASGLRLFLSRLQLLLLGGARGSDRSGTKAQSGGLEKACGPSLDRTVQKCPLPCPALAQTKIPGLAAPLSATGRGWTLPALEGQLGSSAWVGQKKGWRDPDQVEPDL